MKRILSRQGSRGANLTVFVQGMDMGSCECAVPYNYRDAHFSPNGEQTDG